MKAETELLVANGYITIKTGGGSENSTKANQSLGQRPDGMTKGEKPTMPDGMNKGERPTMPEDGNTRRSASIPDGQTQGGQPPQLPDGQTQGERPEMPQDIRQPSNNQDTNSNTNTSTNTSTDESISMKSFKSNN